MTSIPSNIQNRARIVPWRATAELLWVKDAFYPGPNSSDQRYDALAMVQAWSVRGGLPHSIESTAMLTEAIMHDRSGASQLSLQLSYSTAICRFVNGLLDPAQQSHFAISMHTLARNLNLPASFVEIRHAATHETLPSLAVLRTAASRALNWLWSNYWVWVGVTLVDDITHDQEPQDINLARARLLLKQWRKLRRENPTREIKEGENVAESREALAIIRECVTMCRTTEGLDGVLDALLEEKALIPAGKRKSSSLMKGAFLLWLPLLEPLGDSVTTFTEQLVNSMLESLKDTSMDYALDNLKASSVISVLASSCPAPTQEEKEFNKALVSWVKQLTRDSTMLKFEKAAPTELGNEAFDIEYVAKQCIYSPNEWTLDILNHIIECHPSLRLKYSPLALLAGTAAFFTMSLPEKDQKSSKKSRDYLNATTTRSINQIEGELSQFEERLTRMDERMEEWIQLRAGDITNIHANVDGQGGESESEGLPHRWTTYPGTWKPKPLGVL